MENANKLTVSTGEILYWVFFGALFGAKGIGLYDGQTIFKIVLVFSGFCLLAKLSIERYSLSEIIKISAVVFISGISYLISGEKGLLLYGLVIIGMKCVDVKRLFTVGTVIWTAAFLGVTVSALFHMESTVYKVHDKLGMGHIFRWSLGYAHPNVLHISYVILAMLFIYVLGEHFKIKHAIYLFAGNCIVFMYSVSYTGFLLFLCLMVGRIYFMIRKKPGVIEKVLLQTVFPACVIISLIFPLIASGKVFDIVNKLLSTRLALAKYYLTPEFISLFGRRLSEITSNILTMDNAYLFAVITYGIVPFVIICMTTVWMIHKLTGQEKYLEVLLILVISVGGLTEPFLYNTSFKNLSFIYMGALLFSNNDEQKSYRILPLALTKRLNKNISLKPDLWYIVKEKISSICKFSKLKLITGVIGAVFAVTILSFTVSYPEGYVVRRIDCSDISEDIHYYGDEKKYENYKEMSHFQTGEQVEYFSGNIVEMEKIRNAVIAVSAGYVTAYLLCGTVGLIKQKNKTGEADE